MPQKAKQDLQVKDLCYLQLSSMDYNQPDNITPFLQAGGRCPTSHPSRIQELDAADFLI